MTNPTLPDQRTVLEAELRALAPVGGKRRPVKVVEHPAFRAARARLDQPYTVLRLPVAALNRPATWRRGPCGGGAPTITASQEAA